MQTDKLSSELNKLRLEEVSKENIAIKKRIQCVVCLNKDRNIVFLPCNHCICCNDCANILQNNKCPTCRGNIQDKQIVYLS